MDSIHIEQTSLDLVTVRTTLPASPFPAFEIRQEFSSDRLCLRGLRNTDFDLYVRLRSQPEVMKWTAQGVPDLDASASRDHFATMMPPHDVSMYNFAICLRTSGELIGMGGCHRVDGELGWPVLGYMFRKEYWGKGFATEFLKCFLEAWWLLPRREVDLRVDSATVENVDHTRMQPECLIGVTVPDNDASQKVLRKCGLKHVKTWAEEDQGAAEKQTILYGWAATASCPRGCPGS